MKNFYLAILYTSLTAIIIEVTINFLLSKKLNKKIVKKNELEKVEKYFNSLILSSQKESINFFGEMVEKKHLAKKCEKYILIPHEEKNTILFPFLKFDSLTKQDIVEIIKVVQKEKLGKLVITAYEIKKDSYEFVKQYNTIEFVLLDKFQTYNDLFKKYDYYPIINEKIDVKYKNDYKKLIKLAFSREKTKGYLLSSLVVLFSSLLVRYNIYYVIMSSVLLIFALVSFVLPMYQKKVNEELL